MYIEDWLGELYKKGAALSSLLDDSTMPLIHACHLVQADLSDVALLMSVCA